MLRKHELRDELLKLYGYKTVVICVWEEKKTLWIGSDDFTWNLKVKWDYATSYSMELLFDTDYNHVYDNINEYKIILVDEGITLSPAKDNLNVLYTVLLLVHEE